MITFKKKEDGWNIDVDAWKLFKVGLGATALGMAVGMALPKKTPAFQWSLNTSSPSATRNSQENP